jgi:predicted nucleic acid-binding protein
VTIVVITDANVLINLIHIGRLSLLGGLESYEFRVPLEVLNEILEPEQRAAVDAALAAGDIAKITVDTPETLALFGSLRDVMGQGEAACLALAAKGGFYIASDEKKRFRRQAIELIGKERILRTESILVEAIRRKHISVAEADGYKTVLETKRYAMSFASFADLV